MKIDFNFGELLRIKEGLETEIIEYVETDDTYTALKKVKKAIKLMERADYE